MLSDSGRLAATSARLLPLITTGWLAVASSLIHSIALLEMHFSVQNFMVSNSRHTFAEVFAVPSLLSFGSCDFSFTMGLMTPVFWMDSLPL